MTEAEYVEAGKVVELTPKEGALRLWSEIVRNLSLAGYEHAGPEYLRLSRLLVETRTTELMAGQGSADVGWAQIREQAAEAQRLLEPLMASAKLLASLPDQIAMSNTADVSAATKPDVVAKPESSKVKTPAPRRRRKSTKSSKSAKQKVE